MKTLKILFPKTALILLLITVVISSCSSDNDSTGSEQGDYYLTARVDGVDFYLISAVGETSIGLTLDSPTSVGIFTTAVRETVALSYQKKPLLLYREQVKMSVL